MKHRGEILAKAIRNSKIPITKVALEYKCSQRHMYNLFETIDLSNEVMVAFGKIIGHDFSRELPELVEYSYVKEPEGIYENAKNITDKYYQLMEKHIKLIEEYNALKKKHETKAAPSEPSAPKVRQTKKSK